MNRSFYRLNLNLPGRLAAVVSVLFALTLGTAMAASEATPPAANTYTSKAGDTVERVLKNAMPDSPLNATVLRKALAEANPNVVTGKAGQKFKAGTAIHLPEQGALLRNTLEAYTPPGSEAYSRSGYSASDPASRRHWVRYP